MAALSVELLCRMGRVKRVACCMMADRGYALPEHESAWLGDDVSDLSVGAWYMSAATAAKCSLGHAMGGLYVHATGASASAVAADEAPAAGEHERGDIVASAEATHPCAVRAPAPERVTTQARHPATLMLFVDPNFDEAKKREKMVGTDQVKAAIALWREEFPQCPRCILVSPSRLSPDAKKEVAAERACLTLLTHDFLAFPVGRHVMTPPHYALSDVEAFKFLSARKLDGAQLPQLKAADAVAMYYGYTPGTIVRIIRPGGWNVFRVVTA